ncbi:MAG TPA: hypothetical protein DCZ80_01770 [Legionellales bacterium]|nr:hypothetical protein [Legionellales bacterium]
MIKTALIFAAGRGERLMPYTKDTPKPMLMVGNEPLLAFHIQNLKACGIEHIIINHAYLGYKIRQYFGNGQSFGLHIEYLPEPPGALETGGTLAFLKECLHPKHEVLLTINADIYTDYQANPNFELSPNAHAHLVLIPTQKDLPPGNFGLDPQTHQIHVHSKDLIFSGIGFYQLAALQDLPKGRYSIRNWLFTQAQAGQLTGEIYQGLWQDIGTPSAWQKTKLLLAQR